MAAIQSPESPRMAATSPFTTLTRATPNAGPLAPLSAVACGDAHTRNAKNAPIPIKYRMEPNLLRQHMRILR